MFIWNMTFTLNDVDEIARSEVAKVDVSIFTIFYKHSLKEQDMFRELYILQDSEK